MTELEYRKSVINYAKAIAGSLSFLNLLIFLHLVGCGAK